MSETFDPLFRAALVGFMASAHGFNGEYSTDGLQPYGEGLAKQLACIDQLDMLNDEDCAVLEHVAEALAQAGIPVNTPYQKGKAR